MKKNILLFIFLLGTTIIYAQSFNGSISDDWNEPANWTPSGVPGAASAVTINAGKVCRVHVGTNAIITNVSFLAGTLTIEGTLTCNNAASQTVVVAASGVLVVNSGGALNINNSGNNGIRIYGGGNMDVNAGGSVTVNGTSANNGIHNQGTVTNDGTITISNVANQGISNSSVVNNASGTISITGGAIGFFNSKTLTSGGVIDISSTSGVGLQLVAGSVAFTNNGNITVTSAGTYGIRCDVDFTNTGGSSVSINSSGHTGILLPTGKTLINDGTVTIDGAAQVGINSNGSFVNGGTLTLDNNTTGSGLAFQNQSAGNLTNNGTVNITAAKVGLHNTGTMVNPVGQNISITSTTTSGIYQGSAVAIDNSGTLTFSSISMSNAINIAGSGDMNNSGTLILSGSIINGSTGKLVNSGTLKGEGTIDGSKFTNSGVIAPGNSPGTITIGNTYDHSNATYLAEIDPGVGHDVIELPDGISALGGTITLSVTSNPTPTTGYVIVNSPSTDVSGMTFDTENLPADWSIEYNVTNIQAVYLSALPIELLQFKAEKAQLGVLLNWQTTTEKNNDGFELLRSSDGLIWEKIAWIKGNGDSQSTQNYTYLDESPKAGANYYQLKQIDFDGQYEMSDKIIVQWDKQRGISLYPNPASSEVTIKLDQLAVVTEVQLFDNLGQFVKILKQNNGQISLDGIVPGIYFLKVQAGSENYTEKLMIE